MRSRNKMIAGVCAGIAEYFDVDPTIIRVIFVLLSIISAGFSWHFGIYYLDVNYACRFDLNLLRSQSHN